MVSGTQFPGGDPFLQRQNEPSVAISTRNSRHMLAGANDYRTVDLPAQDVLPDDAVTGDAWLGVFKSFDGGQTWTSTLLPGFPQDNSPLGTASPLKGFSTAADPVVRAGTNGLFYYSGVAFNRGTNQGVVFVSRFIDLNNKENGNVVAGTDAIKYVSAFVVDRGSAGQFLDKPWIAVDVPRNNATCTIQVPNGNSTTPQTIPAGNVYLAYTVLVGNDQNIRTKLYLSRSVDCGATWSTPTKLSEGLPVNQGASVAVDPSTGDVYVVWRGFATVNTQNTINIVRSTDGGATFTKATTIKSLPSYSDANPSAPAFFDQGTTATSFRTNAFPAMTVDGSGRVYVAWSQRGVGLGGDARIVVTSSSDFVTWTTPKAVDNADLSDDAHVTFSRGHQFMPSFTFSDGRLMLLYYDERFDHTVGLFSPNDPFAPGADGRFYTERRDKRGELNSNPAAVYTPFVSDFGLTQMRHTVEVRVAQGVPGADPSFTTARVSQYKFGTRGDETGTVGDLQQLQINPPNLPLFQQGAVPFIGDYIDIAGLTMKKTASGWTFNTALTPSPIHIATYTSNQDVRPPLDGNWANYTPIGVGGPSLYNPGVNKPACQVGQEGMRNQNIYASVITQGLLVSSQQNSKPLSTTVPRQFVITVQNATNFDKSFRLTIGNQPTGGVATFTPIPNPIPNPLPSPLLTLDVSVAAHSGIARSVYALSTAPFASIAVNVTEINAPGGTPNNGLSSFVALNADPTVAGLTDPDGGSGVGISTAEIYNPNVSNPNVSNPNVSNPNVSNPNVSNPNVSNPNVSNPNVSNPNVSNPDLANPNVSNPNVSNPNVSNPNVSNPNVSNPNVSNTTLEDGTYTVTNNGNTSGSYTVKLVGNAPAGTPLQLIISKPYGNPLSQNCVLFEQSNNVLLSNVNNPVVLPPTNLTDPRITVPDINNPTISLAPGETALVTVRGNFGTLDDATAKQKMIDILGNLSPVIVAHAPNTNDPTNTPTYAAVLPDLVFDSISNSPKSPTSNDKVTITAMIRNAGGATAAASVGLIKLDTERLGQAFDVPSLAPGATFEISRTVSGLQGGQYTATATADAGGNVTELSETNNTATDTFAVTQVLGLAFDPAAQDFYTASFANTVTVLATDAGGNPVPSAQLGFLQSWDGVKQTAVTDASGHATFTFTGPAVGDGYVMTITGTAPGFTQGTLTKTFSTIPPIQ